MAAMKHDVVERPVVEGDFVQMDAWYSDVWSYVTKDFGPIDEGETRQMICLVRRDRYGKLERRKLDSLTFVGRMIVDERGSLMHGLDRNPLRRVATAAELVEKMARGESLIVALPAFKMIHGAAMRDGERIGTIRDRGDVELADGTIVPFASAAAVTPPSPLC
jgi:hypothetical protein